MDMKNFSFGGITGGGIVAIVAVAAIYIFGGGMSAPDGLKTGAVKVFEVSTKGERLCVDLLKIRDLTEEQKKTVLEASDCFKQINKEVKLVASLLSVQLEPAETEIVVTEPAVIEPVVTETVVTETETIVTEHVAEPFKEPVLTDMLNTENK